MLPEIRAKIAVVTGGAQGLGLGSARRLLHEHYRVAILDLQEHLRPEIEQDLSARGEWAFFSADVSDQGRIREIAAQIAQTWGHVDALVNNAGIFPRHETATLPLDEWERVLRVNLTGTFVCCQTFGQTMLRQASGVIINTASGRAIQGAARGAAYAASKAGIIALTRSLASEWAPYVRVNCVVPGIADTAQPRVELTEEQMHLAAQRIPLGRIGQPSDIAGAVAFLLSDDASYITGQCIAVNGGAIMM